MESLGIFETEPGGSRRSLRQQSQHALQGSYVFSRFLVSVVAAPGRVCLHPPACQTKQDRVAIRSSMVHVVGSGSDERAEELERFRQRASIIPAAPLEKCETKEF